MKELKVKATDKNLSRVLNMTEDFLKGHCCEEIKNEILISIDEMFINIAHYAYGEGEGYALITLELLEYPKRLKIVLKDQGTEFNPFAKEDPDTDLSMEERKIGGLGIFMVKDYMDDYSYEYLNGYNIVTLEKNL